MEGIIRKPLPTLTLAVLLTALVSCDAPTGPGSRDTTGPMPTLAEPLPFANDTVEAAVVTLRYVVRDAADLASVGWRGWRTHNGVVLPESEDVPVRAGAAVAGEITIPVEAGAYQVELVAIDSAGNIGKGDTLRFTVVDTRAPVVSLASVADGATTTDSVVRILIEDASREVTVSYRNLWLYDASDEQFRNGSGGSWSFPLFWGPNEIVVTAVDPSGNTTTLNAVVRRHPADVAQVTDVEGDLRSGCAIDAAGTASCWESYPMESYPPHAETRPVVVPGGVAFRTAPTAGESHCAIAADGSTRCWGMARSGSLGNGDSRYLVPYETPQAADGPALSRIAGGGDFSCAVAADGLAYCWGTNSRRQLGTATDELCWSVLWNQPVQDTPCSSVPVRVASDERWQQITTGSTHACGITVEGVAYCWGRTNSGAFGTGMAVDTATTPKPVGTAARFVSIGTSGDRTCAVSTDGAAYCWGAVPQGLTDAAAPYTPAHVRGGLAFQSIGPSCGLTTVGKVHCWGTGPLYASQPVPLRLDLTFTSVSDSHQCGVATDGTAYCWDERLEPIPLRVP